MLQPAKEVDEELEQEEEDEDVKERLKRLARDSYLVPQDPVYYYATNGYGMLQTGEDRRVRVCACDG